MSDSFDPYYTWLGIPPEDQPADHYRLLGVKRFEANGDVLSNAADQRMAHVRTYQSGPRAEFSQRLLNELAAARGCLLDDAKRATYDARLQQAEAQASAAQAAPAMTEIAGPSAHFSPDPPISIDVAPAAPGKASAAQQRDMAELVRHPLAIAAAGGVVGFLVLVLIFVLVLPGGGDSSVSSSGGSPGSSERKPGAGNQGGVRNGSSSPDPRPVGIAGIGGNGAAPVGGLSSARPPQENLPSKPSSSAPAVDPAPATADGEEFGEPIDLLRRINIRRDVRRGRASMRSWELFTSDAENRPSLVITSYTPPPEYQIEAEVNRLEGEGAFYLGLVVGGRQCVLAIDSFVNLGGISGVTTIDGIRPTHPDYQFEHRGPLLLNNKPTTVTCTVRKERITAACDGEVFFDWRGDPQRLGQYPPLVVSPMDRLYVGSWSSRIHIKKLTVRPLKTTAAPADAPSPESSAAPPNLARVEPAPQSAAPQETEAADPQPAPGRAALPAGAELEAARKAVRELFKEELAGVSNAQDAFALVQRLRGAADSDPEGVAAKYALLIEALDLAVETGLSEEALALTDAIASSFEVDAFELKADVYKRLLRSLRLPQNLTELAKLAETHAKNALATGEFEAGQQMAEAAEDAAVRAKNARLRAEIKPFSDTAKRLLRKQQAAERAAETLAENADDVEANLRWGMFQCICLNDWTEGLPVLAKGGDDLCAVAARAELEGVDTPTRQKQVAEKWFEAARAADDLEKPSLLARARHWYRQCRPRMQGAEGADVDQKIQEIGLQMPGDPVLASAGAKSATSSSGSGSRSVTAALPRGAFPGMMGRILRNGQDAAISISYSPSARISHDELHRLLLDMGGLERNGRVQIVLRGFLFVPKSTNVKVRHVGGSSNGGVHTLKVDGKTLGMVGDDRSKDDTYDLPLLRGVHAVEWELRGGDIGVSYISFDEADTGRSVEVYYNDKLRDASRGGARKYIYFRQNR